MIKIQEIFKYFLSFDVVAQHPLKIFINSLFYFFALATLYYLAKFFIYKRVGKFYLGFFTLLSAFGITTPYIFVTPLSIPAMLNLDKTRFFLESIFFICLLIHLIASFFIYHSSFLSKKMGKYLSSVVHLFIVFFSMIGLIVMYTAMFDYHFMLNYGFSASIITSAIITMVLMMILWEIIEVLVDKYIIGYPFMSPSRQDTILDLSLGFLGLILAAFVILVKQEVILKFLV